MMKKLIEQLKKSWKNWRHRQIFSDEAMIYRARNELRDDLQWFGHHPVINAIIQRHIDLIAPDWEKRHLLHQGEFRSKMGLGHNPTTFIISTKDTGPLAVIPLGHLEKMLAREKQADVHVFMIYGKEEAHGRLTMYAYDTGTGTLGQLPSTESFASLRNLDASAYGEKHA